MKIVYTKSLFGHCLDTFNLSGEQGKNSLGPMQIHTCTCTSASNWQSAIDQSLSKTSLRSRYLFKACDTYLVLVVVSSKSNGPLVNGKSVHHR